MKQFHVIATPHEDIVAGRLTMDVFAADLWLVYNNKGPEEYRDKDIFFRKTFLTKGLKNLLEVVKKRLDGSGGDAVIQLQTPFGGGKTHSLIALYHKSKEWNANVVVLVGTELDPHDVTPWGLFEKQLTGKIENFKEKTAPGKEKLRELLAENRPLLILMDEILEYVTKAAGVEVGNSNLGAQTLAFLQELSEVASALPKICLVITLPSSILEQYDENAEKVFQQLQKITGRVEKIYTPVEDEEIADVVNRRLFSAVNREAAKDVVIEIVEYFRRENVLPNGMEASEYRKRFLKSYPFLPEVIDVFYKRWGSYPTFQRTRGVLRILSLVTHSLLKTNKSYISLGDFDLDNQEIRRELLKHIGNEYDSIIAADITSSNSGAKQVDGSLGESYRHLMIGTRSATTIFLYSFSVGAENGATLKEIKRSAAIYNNPSSVVADAVEKLREKLFYLDEMGGKYLFKKTPNINKILVNKMESIEDKELEEEEHNLLSQIIGTGKLKIYLWPTKPEDIPDDKNLKLIILKEENRKLMKDILENKGVTPRVYRNTIFFLVSTPSGRASLLNTIKRKLAYERILTDTSLSLTETQINDVKKRLKKEREGTISKIREAYRTLLVPAKDDFEILDLGIPTYGERININREVYNTLREEGKIIEKMAPIVIQEKYMKGKEYVLTKQIYEASLRTLGEARFATESVLEDCIIEGVKKGIFGLGILEKDIPNCKYWKEKPYVTFDDSEIIIVAEMCEKKHETMEESREIPTIEADRELEGDRITQTYPSEGTTKRTLELEFTIPKGKVSQILGLINYIQSKFDRVKIKIVATEGEITEREFEDKIKEGLSQLGIYVDFS